MTRINHFYYTRLIFVTLLLVNRSVQADNYTALTQTYETILQYCRY